jgi:hypothetical protein
MVQDYMTNLHHQMFKAVLGLSVSILRTIVIEGVENIGALAVFSHPITP